MRIISVLVIGALLSGCSSGSMLTRSIDYTASNQQTCAGYGFQPNTDAFAQCMFELDQIRQERDENARARRSAALLALGRTMMQPSPRPTYCNTNTFGTATNYGYGTNLNANSTTVCR